MDACAAYPVEAATEWTLRRAHPTRRRGRARRRRPRRRRRTSRPTGEPPSRSNPRRTMTTTTTRRTATMTDAPRLLPTHAAVGEGFPRRRARVLASRVRTKASPRDGKTRDGRETRNLRPPRRGRPAGLLGLGPPPPRVATPGRARDSSTTHRSTTFERLAARRTAAGDEERRRGHRRPKRRCTRRRRSSEDSDDEATRRAAAGALAACVSAPGFRARAESSSLNFFRVAIDKRGGGDDRKEVRARRAAPARRRRRFIRLRGFIGGRRVELASRPPRVRGRRRMVGRGRG